MSVEAGLDLRASRLLRWYPRTWRERYGEEFVALLRAEIDEQPRSWRRDVDVRWHGARARLSAVGLGGLPVRDRNAIRTLEAFSLVCFLGCLVSLWSQILSGSSTAPYAHPSIAAMRIVIAVTFAVIGLRTLGGISTLARRIGRVHLGGQVRALVPSLLALGIGITMFAAGLVSVWSSLRWGITPTSVTTVASESISTYWVHPHLLREYRDAQIAWMLVSPLALVVIVSGGVGLHRVLDEIAPVDGSLARPVPWLPVLLAPALLVSAWWVISSQHFQALYLRAGTLDFAMIVVMTASLAVRAEVARSSRRVAR